MIEKKVALVTGAAQGIGRAVAERFRAQGWRVALFDWDDAALDETARAFGPDALAIHGDVSRAADAARAVAAVKAEWGRLDALVNNAAVAEFGPILDTEEDAWRHILDVNLTGPFLLTNAAVPLMIESGSSGSGGGSGGAVVNVTSISGLRASTLRVAYGTSKAALGHLTQQQAVEFAEVGIRVNAVAPGPVETAMARKVHSAAIRQDYADAIPLARYGTEGELAAVICFLCSPDASYVTGQIIGVDGGFSAVGIGLKALRGQV